MFDPRTMADNMSSVQQFWLFGLVGAGILGGVGDYITTQLGFSVGLTESNPVAKWLQAKLGQAPAAFVAIAGFIFSAGLLSLASPKAALVYAAGIAGTEIFMTIRNYRLYKSLKKK